MKQLWSMNLGVNVQYSSRVIPKRRTGPHRATILGLGYGSANGLRIPESMIVSPEWLLRRDLQR